MNPKDEKLADRIDHAIATASNDDYSKAGTRERERHVERIMVMREAAKRIRALSAALTTAEAAMSIVEPRSDKAKYLEALTTVRSVRLKPEMRKR